MRKAPGDRFASAGQMLDALERVPEDSVLLLSYERLLADVVRRPLGGLRLGLRWRGARAPRAPVRWVSVRSGCWRFAGAGTPPRWTARVARWRR